jgi:hypothetical protein
VIKKPVTATGWLQTGETENDRIMNLKKLLNFGAIALSLACLPAYAQTINNTYADGDLILDFSKVGATYDVEVDLGNLASLTNAATTAGGTVQISAYNVTNQVVGIFGSVNSLSFSVFGIQNNASGSVTANTSYLSDQQSGTSPNSAPNDLTGSVQNTLKSTELGILGLDGFGGYQINGLLPWSAANAANATNNSATVAIIPTASTSSYTSLVGGFNGAPSGFPKNTTSASFSTSGSSTISDLFEFDPVGTSHKAVYVGYFTFKSNGTLYFSLPTPPRTIITSITKNGGTVSVNFNMVSGTNYRLLYTTNIALNLSSWTIVPGSVSGTGATGTLSDTSATDPVRFYTVQSY